MARAGQTTFSLDSIPEGATIGPDYGVHVNGELLGFVDSGSIPANMPRISGNVGIDQFRTMAHDAAPEITREELEATLERTNASRGGEDFGGMVLGDILETPVFGTTIGNISTLGGETTRRSEEFLEGADPLISEGARDFVTHTATGLIGSAAGTPLNVQATDYDIAGGGRAGEESAVSGGQQHGINAALYMIGSDLYNTLYPPSGIETTPLPEYPYAPPTEIPPGTPPVGAPPGGAPPGGTPPGGTPGDTPGDPSLWDSIKDLVSGLLQGGGGGGGDGGSNSFTAPSGNELLQGDPNIAAATINPNAGYQPRQNAYAAALMGQGRGQNPAYLQSLAGALRNPNG